MSITEDNVKNLIIETLGLEDIQPEDMESELPLFEEGWGLDSIDALELGVALKKKYNISFDGDNASHKEHFYSVKTLTQFINSYVEKNNEGK